MKWLALGAAVAVLLFGLGVSAPQPWGELLVGLAAVPMPLAMGVAALRHRLWDVDLAISTGLRHALLSLIAIAVYTVVVSSLGAFTGAPVVATAVVAVVLLPLQDRLTRLVNRLVHGESDDPDTALARLGARLEATGDPAQIADRLLPAVVERLAALLRSPGSPPRQAAGDRRARGGAPLGSLGTSPGADRRRRLRFPNSRSGSGRSSTWWPAD